jgi:DNA-binding MarR family transcriptional regulator
LTKKTALQRLAEAGSNDSLARLLLRAARSVNEQIVERLQRMGHPAVRPAHTAVFAHLDADGTRPIVLAQRAGMTRQAISELVRELEGVGYVSVHPDPADGRASLVALTPLGQKFCLDAAEAISHIEAEWARHLDDPHLNDLRQALRELIAEGE